MILALVSIMIGSLLTNFFSPVQSLRIQRSGLRLTSRLYNSRPTSNSFSLDSSLLANDPDLIIAHLTSRNADEILISRIGEVKELREERSNWISEGDKAKGYRKSLSKQIGTLMKEGKEDEVNRLKKVVADASVLSAEADNKIAEIDDKISQILQIVPNLLDDRVPDGKDETDNEIVSSWGEEKKKIGEQYRWHDEVAKSLGGLDMEGAVRISGARFSVLVGPIARLERALSQYFLDFHVSRGYTEVSVPYMVTRSTLEGTGQLPKFEDDLFKVGHSIGGEDAFMIPTAEVPVTNLFRGQLLNATQIPMKLVAHTPCFRAEAGSYGRDTRGLIRQHQFHKVEMVHICEPSQSKQIHEEMTAGAEELLQSLDLPYRKVLLCAGDTGFGARICYDLEVWMPGQQEYREISSCSNCYDFQSRRMGLRYKVPVASGDKKKKSTVYPHTLNGSGLAVGRALVAILENYQEEDGSLIIPEKLRPYMNGIEKISPPADQKSPYQYTAE